MKKNNNHIHMSENEKQKTPLPNEVTPDNAFIKISTIAMHVADRYKLKMLRLNDKT